jgi:hypothetical protein
VVTIEQYISVQYQAVTGTFEFWEDVPLLMAGLPGERTDPGSQTGLVLAIHRAFAATRDPLCLTVVNLRPGPDDDLLTCSWAGEATTTIKGNPPAGRALPENRKQGDLGLAAMLQPAPLGAVIPRPWPARFTVDGPALAGDPELLPALHVRGASRFTADYDPRLDIITAWTAEINGRPARHQALALVTPVPR